MKQAANLSEPEPEEDGRMAAQASEDLSRDVAHLSLHESSNTESKGKAPMLAGLREEPQTTPHCEQGKSRIFDKNEESEKDLESSLREELTEINDASKCSPTHASTAGLDESNEVEGGKSIGSSDRSTSPFPEYSDSNAPISGVNPTSSSLENVVNLRDHPRDPQVHRQFRCRTCDCLWVEKERNYHFQLCYKHGRSVQLRKYYKRSRDTYGPLSDMDTEGREVVVAGPDEYVPLNPDEPDCQICRTLEAQKAVDRITGVVTTPQQAQLTASGSAAPSDPLREEPEAHSSNFLARAFRSIRSSSTTEDPSAAGSGSDSANDGSRPAFPPGLPENLGSSAAGIGAPRSAFRIKAPISKDQTRSDASSGPPEEPRALVAPVIPPGPIPAPTLSQAPHLAYEPSDATDARQTRRPRALQIPRSSTEPSTGPSTTSVTGPSSSNQTPMTTAGLENTRPDFGISRPSTPPGENRENESGTPTYRERIEYEGERPVMRYTPGGEAGSSSGVVAVPKDNPPPYGSIDPHMPIAVNPAEVEPVTVKEKITRKFSETKDNIKDAFLQCAGTGTRHM